MHDDPPGGGSSPFLSQVQPLLPWLGRARDLGFLGPGPVESHVAHAVGFADAAGPPPKSLLDLGSGGGVPGLVLCAVWPTATGVLLDANERRTAFLSSVVEGLGWSPRVRVVRARAEEAGRAPDLRGRAALVVSRGFGPPAVVAECAAPLLQPGGRLVVSEPPVDDRERWPASELGTLGLVPEGPFKSEAGRFQVLRQDRPCPDAYPRRVGVPAKRPLW